MTKQDYLQHAYSFHRWAQVFGLPWRDAGSKRFALLCKAKALIASDRASDME
ncbi:hypothetical protein [Pseudomonas phage Nerthus]|uniref:Uncharacterized protein n=1 Tax=Pseudomonas phage Nerthus TaxID=2163984 RepID=A0A2S1GMQ8_9CAUD|nr:hypothetical protein HOT09_gp01 [Pseudomonas phage Nerthus]AWD90633.1 hypothetical protein [Pseudomonas phage Nerthus]